MTKKRNLLFATLFPLLCLTLGCNHRPNFGPQGTIGFQRNRAVVHDPYPSNELGPPIVGGRPISYDRPSSQPAAIQGSPYAPRSRRGAAYVPQNGF